MSVCPICASENMARLRVREMMTGTRLEFVYFRCQGCGSLHLEDPYPDLTAYYPRDYYSFSSQRDSRYSHPVKSALIAARTSAGVLGGSLLGAVLGRLRPDPMHGILRLTSMRRDSRILDVGCGDAALLSELANAGFTQLHGIDPYIDHEISHAAFKVSRHGLGDMAGAWDVIMLHHVFEHLADPAEAMSNLQRLLAPAGTVLIRTPLADSWAFDHYGVDWVQIDAPRHLHIYTVQSISTLAARSGLVVEQVVFDSTAFQFWGSELYRRDISLREYEAGSSPRFPKEQWRRWDAMAADLNRAGRGDQAAFILRKQDDNSAGDLFGTANALGERVS